MLVFQTKCVNLVLAPSSITVAVTMAGWASVRWPRVAHVHRVASVKLHVAGWLWLTGALTATTDTICRYYTTIATGRNSLQWISHLSGCSWLCCRLIIINYGGLLVRARVGQTFQWWDLFCSELWSQFHAGLACQSRGEWDFLILL